jgi:hypothetical protein
MRLYMHIYRMSQEERSIFWEVMVSVILSKQVYMYMCPMFRRQLAIFSYNKYCKETLHDLLKISEPFKLDVTVNS